MTRKTRRMSEWSCFERSFLQPERIANILRRLRNKFLIRFVLRLKCLMTVLAIGVGVLIVREEDPEFRDKACCF